jgi:hypothetical protein
LATKDNLLASAYRTLKVMPPRLNEAHPITEPKTKMEKNPRGLYYWERSWLNNKEVTKGRNKHGRSS